MKVVLIAQTVVNRDALAALGYDHNGAADADEVAEFGGRNCYRSFNRPNPGTRSNADYLAHILEIGHESVLEHASATFYIEASRSLLAEITRHRHLSFSVVSQRYVDPVTLGVHYPPAIDQLPEEAKRLAKLELRRAAEQTASRYQELHDIFVENGLPRKQAREAARAVLPNMTNSPMVVSTNHRGWRYVIKNRWSTSADAEIRQLAGELLTQLREIAPGTYRDMPDLPFGSDPQRTAQ